MCFFIPVYLTGITSILTAFFVLQICIFNDHRNALSTADAEAG